MASIAFNARRFTGTYFARANAAVIIDRAPIHVNFLNTDSGEIVAFARYGVGLKVFGQFAIPLNLFATQPVPTHARIENHGLIAARISAIETDSSRDQLINTGEINGHVRLADYNDSVFNSGLITGSVRMGEGDDTVINSGTITETVLLGDGADIFWGIGGVTTGLIDGGLGNDSFYIVSTNVAVTGGAGYDVVYTRADFVSAGGIEVIDATGYVSVSLTAGNTAEIILGNGADTQINGLGGDDKIVAYAGDDEIDGGGGNDHISGFGGDDTLYGNVGNYTIRGGEGDDVIVGGEGGDLLAGWQGADSFVLRDLTDSGFGVDSDQIWGFARGEDVIDISEINAGQFDFLCTGALSGSGDAKLRYTVSGFGHAQVFLDADGDGTVDARIIVFGTPVLDADDFIL